MALSRPRSSLAEATTWVFFERRSAYSHISKALVNSAKWPSQEPAADLPHFELECCVASRPPDLCASQLPPLFDLPNNSEH